MLELNGNDGYIIVQKSIQDNENGTQFGSCLSCQLKKMYTKSRIGMLSVMIEGTRPQGKNTGGVDTLLEQLFSILW